jgi:hypothetical protein
MGVKGGNRVVSATANTVLDASYTIDPDNTSMPFSYEWKCSNPCPDAEKSGGNLIYFLKNT